MPQSPAMPIYEPIIALPESMCQAINDIKVGNSINNLIANFTVIENMKNYLVLRIEFVYVNMPKRIL